MAAPEMHYFTRVTEHGAGTSRTAPAQRSGVPVRITAADGTFSLGMPSSVRTAAGAAPADATGPAPTQRGGLVVLMHPAEQARYSSGAPDPRRLARRRRRRGRGDALGDGGPAAVAAS